MMRPPSGVAAGHVVTDRPAFWCGTYNYLADLAAAKLSAADYAISVRKLYDVLVEDTGHPAAVWELIDFQLSFGRWVSSRVVPRTSPKKRPPQGGHGRKRTVRPSVQWERISAKHRELALELLPKPPRRKPGRPEGARGNKAYNKRYKLCLDWNYETTLNPSLTKEQFAKKHLGITDAEYDADFDLNDPDKDGPLHRKVAALVQDLKPARMKQLDEGQRRAIKLIFPLVNASNQYLVLRWRQAKQNSPALTKEDFLQEYFGWSRDRKRHPIETDMVHEYLAKLDEAEKQLTNSERG